MPKIIRKINYILFIVFLSACNRVIIEPYVSENAIAIKGMEMKDNEYADLHPIGDAIGDSRIVMLGEQDHGDAATFLAKTRLIKYLHEEKGFNVIAFESDFFALTQGWDKLTKQKDDINQFIRSNVFSIWSHCDACEHLLYEYIPNSLFTKKPMQLTGFDCQMMLGYSKQNLAKSIDSIIRQYQLPIIKTEIYQKLIKEDISTLLSQYQKRNESQPFHISMDNILSEIESQLASKAGTGDYWLLIIQNLLQYNREFIAKNHIDGNSVRDKQMALNLLWLLNQKIKNEKVIVWAHNAHIINNADRLSYSKNSFINMTTHLLNMIPSNEKVYVLGFTSGRGTTGRLGQKQYSIPFGETKSIDGILFALKYPFAFLDFNAFNRKYPNYRKPFLMKGIHHMYGKEQWNKHYNGIFYIKEMYPCNPID
jgi:erythromycin esterase-like protein